MPYSEPEPDSGDARFSSVAAVIYGKGFKAVNTAQVVEGLPGIEDRLGSSGIWYFGDLDPAGLDIPRKINASRREANLSLLKPGRILYRDLMGHGHKVAYQRSQKSYHDRKWAVQWLGEVLAALYLEQVESFRWPQEGLSERNLVQAFMEISQDSLGGEVLNLLKIDCLSGMKQGRYSYNRDLSQGLTACIGGWKACLDRTHALSFNPGR